MIYYQDSTTPAASAFVYPGDVDFEICLNMNSWDNVSSAMKALFPSVDLPPLFYYYNQKRMTNSSGTYLYKKARWYYSSDKEYIDFEKVGSSVWRPTGMFIKIGQLLTSTFAITSSTYLANVVKAIYSMNGDRYIHGYLETYCGSNKNMVPVTGIVTSATKFEFQTNVKNTKDNTVYLVDATYNAGTWTVTKVSLGTLA